FRSFRGRSSWDPSPEVHRLSSPAGILMRPETRETIRCIGNAGLSLDVWVYHPQLGEVVDLCRQFPELPVIINHVGGPVGFGPYESRKEEVFREWSASLKELANSPNVSMKLGGLGMRCAGY